jgi:hypothetical protein
MPAKTLASNLGEVPKAEGVRLKQKTRPNTGREFDSRGSTRFALSAVEGHLFSL